MVVIAVVVVVVVIASVVALVVVVKADTIVDSTQRRCNSQLLGSLQLGVDSGVKRNQMRHFRFRFGDGDGAFKQFRGLFQAPVLYVDRTQRLVGELAVRIDFERLEQELLTAVANWTRLEQRRSHTLAISLEATEGQVHVHVAVVWLALLKSGMIRSC